MAGKLSGKVTMYYAVLIALHNAIGADAMTLETMSLTGVWMC